MSWNVINDVRFKIRQISNYFNVCNVRRVPVAQGFSEVDDKKREDDEKKKLKKGK